MLTAIERRRLRRFEAEREAIRQQSKSRMGERNLKAMLLRAQGKTFTEIGEALGMSSSRARGVVVAETVKILSRHGNHVLSWDTNDENVRQAVWSAATESAVSRVRAMTNANGVTQLEREL